MSANPTSWFHCGRCGSLFLSASGDSEERFCTSCGCKPSLGIDPFHADQPAFPEAASVDPTENAESAGARRKAPHKKKRQSFFMLKLVAAWVAVLVAIVYGAKTLWPEEAPSRATAKGGAPNKAAPSAEDIELLKEASPLCGETLMAFLNAGTPEGRNQFVSNPITTAARMAQFYSMNPLTGFDPRTMGITGRSVVHLPKGTAVEVQMKSADGHSMDAVFVKENDEWKLDWDHYARYSDSPWALFLAGNGEAEGEFRLLARERLADERKNEDSISLVLYAPRFGYAGDTGFQSPEFIVKRNTRNGRLLDAAFKLEREGKPLFGVTLPSINPEELIRVRVKIRRFETNGERHFEIAEVIACHWYSTDDPGVEITEPTAEKK